MRTVYAITLSTLLAVACAAPAANPSEDSNQAVTGNDSPNDTNISCAAQADSANESSLDLKLVHDTDTHVLNVSGTQNDGSTVTFVANAFSSMTRNNVSTLYFGGTGTVVDADKTKHEVHSFAIVHPGEDGFEDPASRSVTVQFGLAKNAPEVAEQVHPALAHAKCSSKNTFASERL